MKDKGALSKAGLKPALDNVFIVANYSASLLPIILHYCCQLLCITNCHFLCSFIYRLQKYGFDARIRDLTNQILISARRLNETKSSGDNTFLEKVYQQVSGLGRNTQGLGKTGFVDLFSKNIIYVLAMSSQLKNDLKIEEHIEKYTSNIARFSLITCSTDVRGFYEMLTYQIPRI
ncbi:hypothetical protein [Pedobacter sp. CG_S7]|uniref:hypothetical protein n=1 Tax=Pedobacter sp. CG_S7 TaxID=3143930 RepID=UPI003396DC1C